MRRGTAQLPAICWPQSMAATERRRSLWPSAKYRACMPPFGITGIVGKPRGLVVRSFAAPQKPS
jgi:hypothetical protein